MSQLSFVLVPRSMREADGVKLSICGAGTQGFGGSADAGEPASPRRPDARNSAILMLVAKR